MDRLCKIIGSVFYIGYLPVAPGTLGSLAALILCYFLRHNPLIMGIAIVVVIVLGLLTAKRMEELFNEKDPGEIVIDEFAGMLVSLYLLPFSMGYVVSGFLLFRFFDIVKPKPIREFEKLDGSIGIMADDLIAGVYTNFILQIVYMVNLLCKT
jgi:phosphatidylglycerophosphatase A